MISSLPIHENVSLAPFTTFRVGGPARYFVDAVSDEDVARAFEFARIRGLEVFILGGGSNVLVSDNGFDGLVMRIALKGVIANGAVLTAAAGEDWDHFVEHCVSIDLAGVECLSGIPGTVGGTPVQNVGAYGQDVSETTVSAKCYDRLADEIVTLSNAECGFEYRKSIFNTSERDHYVVLSVTFEMEKSGKPKIVYKDLVEAFGGREPTLKEARDSVLRIRRAKSMVIDPDDPNRMSAGSFFKNPIVPRHRFDEIQNDQSERMPQYSESDDKVKIPAAWLIEHAGFQKGFAAGNAGISTNHTLAIINRGNATAAEIINLKNTIQKAVAERFDIELVPEPVFIGEF